MGGLGSTAAREAGALRAAALAAGLRFEPAAVAAVQQRPAVARATAASGHQDPVGAAEVARTQVARAAAGTAAAVGAAAAGAVAAAAGTGELALPGGPGAADSADGDLEGLARRDGQVRAGLTAQSAGCAGVRGLGRTKPAALPPSAPKRSTVTAVTPAGTVKVSVPTAA